MRTFPAQRQQEIAAQVQRMLERSSAFRSLGRGERDSIARNTEAVVAALASAEPAAPGKAGDRADPYHPGSLGWKPRVARGLEVPGPSSAPGAAFTAQSVSEGVRQVGRIVNEINFPQFVASLIKGTFDAIVDASIEQMKAYAELVKSVAMSLNDFRDQNTTEEQGEELLASKYPDFFSMASLDGVRGLTVNDEAMDLALPDFRADLGLDDDVSELDEETVRNRLVPAARNEVARGRQKLLATMVLMGINRIIVTDGKINAKVRFQFSATDSMAQQRFDVGYANLGATTLVEERTGELSDSAQASGSNAEGEWAAAGGASYAKGLRREVSMPNIKVTSQVQTDAQGSLSASGNLLGEVSINFRSETFPLERMIDSQQMTLLNDAQHGFGRAAPASAPTGAAAPAAAPAPVPVPGP